MISLATPAGSSSPRLPSASTLLLTVLAALHLTGCEQLGIDDPAKLAAAKEAEGKAVGGACRHSGRALEDCYTLNPKALKAAVFAGWRDMDGYMRENKIENATPTETRAKPAEPKASEGKAPEPSTADKAKPAKH